MGHLDLACFTKNYYHGPYNLPI